MNPCRNVSRGIYYSEVRLLVGFAIPTTAVNESKGIRENLLSKINHPVTIPRFGGAESLNAAVAAGITVGQMVGQ